MAQISAQLTFLMYAAMSFSMLYFSMACVAQSTASCCMSSDMSAFLITAFLSVMAPENVETNKDQSPLRVKQWGHSWVFLP